MSSDIWNPWHGCRKYSEGCDHCYMYYLDNERGKSGREIYKVKTNYELLRSFPPTRPYHSTGVLRKCVIYEGKMKNHDLMKIPRLSCAICRSPSRRPAPNVTMIMQASMAIRINADDHIC